MKQSFVIPFRSKELKRTVSQYTFCQQFLPIDHRIHTIHFCLCSHSFCTECCSFILLSMSSQPNCTSFCPPLDLQIPAGSFC